MEQRYGDVVHKLAGDLDLLDQETTARFRVLQEHLRELREFLDERFEEEPPSVPDFEDHLI